MFDWIIAGAFGIWIMANYWSLVQLLVFIVFSILAYRRLIAPVGIMQTQNYKDNQKSMTIPKTRKVITILFYLTILIMGIILFSFGIYKDVS